MINHFIYIYIFTSIISQIYTQRFSWSALLKGEEISSNSERCSSTGQILDLLPRYHQFESHKPHGYWRFTWSLTSWSMRLISWGPCKLARTPTLIIIIKKFQAKVIYKKKVEAAWQRFSFLHACYCINLKTWVIFGITI
jgi:hypothetical protein